MSSTDTIKHPDLYAEITAFCEAKGIKPSRFGQDALGDPAFINTLKRGRELRRDTIASIRLFMATGQRRSDRGRG